MRPFIRAFKLAEPEMRLDMINGKISNFSNRINNSPGYAINVIASLLKFNVRKLKPDDNGKIIIDVIPNCENSTNSFGLVSNSQ